MKLEMLSVRDFLRGPTFRYLLAGGFVALLNLSLPLALNWAGLPIQAAIAIGYFVAVSVQFTLQRTFVWSHVEVFALSARRQAGIYVVIAAIQYPLYALSTAFLPSVLGVSHRVVYVGTVMVVTIITYLVLRTRVFHSADSSEPTGVKVA